MSKGEAARPNGSEAKLSRATVGRLSLYLRYAQQLISEGVATVSSGKLGEALGVTDAQVRKDLASLGHLGYPGVGYYPQELASVIRHVLGLDRSWSVVLVGVGNLARALLRYQGFRRQGFHIVGVFDADPAKIGERVEELTIQPMENLPQVVAAFGAQLGIITVPAEAAQPVADLLVEAGVKGILNFAPNVVKTPPGVSTLSVDLTTQLEQLSFLVLTSGAVP